MISEWTMKNLLYMYAWRIGLHSFSAVLPEPYMRACLGRIPQVVRQMLYK